MRTAVPDRTAWLRLAVRHWGAGCESIESRTLILTNTTHLSSRLGLIILGFMVTAAMFVTVWVNLGRLSSAHLSLLGSAVRANRIVTLVWAPDPLQTSPVTLMTLA
jgi:hypothetical protein